MFPKDAGWPTTQRAIRSLERYAFVSIVQARPRDSGCFVKHKLLVRTC
jgi:hypothetical protein